MNRILAIVLALVLGTSLAFSAEILQPNIQVGSNWTFKKVDMYTGLTKSTWKNVVQSKTENVYNIVRYDMQGAVIRQYSLTKNLGQGSPIAGGKVGDGNLYMFPLKLGDSWTTKGYWVNNRNEEGYDEVTYTVQGEQELTVEAGKFAVIKVTGSGKWHNFTQNGSGSLSIVSYYSPSAQVTVRTEWTTSYGQNTPTRDAFELIAFELK